MDFSPRSTLNKNCFKRKNIYHTHTLSEKLPNVVIIGARNFNDMRAFCQIRQNCYVDKIFAWELQMENFNTVKELNKMIFNNLFVLLIFVE